MKTPSEVKVGSQNAVQLRRSTPSVPAVIEYKKMRFMIMDRPTNSNISHYIEELKQRDVHEVVRVCEPTYNVEPLRKEGIKVLEILLAEAREIDGNGEIGDEIDTLEI